MQIYEAKQIVLGLSKFYKPPKPALIPVMGENLRGIAGAIIMNMKACRYASEYDAYIAMKIAHVLGGGICAEGTWVTEQEILDLEREAFMSLCGEKKTQDRISAMLSTGKPLRN
jgi:3-hydroxyacyl-CoA dehydrogenase